MLVFVNDCADRFREKEQAEVLSRGSVFGQRSFLMCRVVDVSLDDERSSITVCGSLLREKCVLVAQWNGIDL